MAALHEESRPRTWADVAGQDVAVSAIRRCLSRGWGGRAWWITGASGTGKTTLAKLIASEGASELATEEILAGGLTPAGVRELERQYSRRPLPIDGKAGWCIVVNECHGLRRDTVRALLDTLERIPDYVVWVFTTTNQGQAAFFDDDQDGDAAPLVSRCQEIRLADGPAVRKALALRAKAVAQSAGCDGLPDAVYERCVDACRGNLRMVLQRVESGQLADEARSELTRQLMALPLSSPARGALQAQLDVLA
jgi:replication-associated recombination protein RarA